MDVTLFLALMPIMVCAMWGMIFLLDYIIRRDEARKYLCIFMFTATMLYLGHCAFFLRAVEVVPYTDVLYGICNLAVYPLYLIYIVYLTTGRVKPLYWLMLLPSLLCGVVYAVLYALMDESSCQLFVHQYLYGNTTSALSGLALAQAWVHHVCKGIFLLLVAVVCVKGNLLIRGFGRQVASGYADVEGRTLHPVRVLLFLFTFISLFSVVFLILGRSRFAVGNLFLSIPSVLFSSMLFAIGYVGSQPMFSYREYDEEQEEDLSVHDLKPMEDCPSRIESLAVEVERLMEEERLYREPDLRITDLARRLGTNSKYVSLAFNQVIGHSFADYVNCYRIRHAQELRQQHPDMTVAEIAHRVGYRSMQSFYRNQKKFQKSLTLSGRSDKACPDESVQ